MLAPLVLLILAANPPAPPRDCRIEATPLELVVTSRGKIVRYPLSEAEVPSAPGASGLQVTALGVPNSTMVLAALRETWSGVAPVGVGHLYAIDCAEPKIELALKAPGVDFGRIAVARDGRWIVGGWGGLRVLEPATRRLTPLTSPPRFGDPTCWSARDGETAPAADVPIVGDGGVAFATAGGEEEVHFMRAGACGYEAEIASREYVLLIDRGVLRRVAAIAAYVRVDETIVVGDGGATCAQQTGGTLWARKGGAWQTTRINKSGRAGVARVAKLANGPWLALTAICETGAGKAGGDLYVSDDFVDWEVVAAVPEGLDMGMTRGAGIGELIVADTAAHIAFGASDQRQWLSSSDGHTWRTTRAPTVAKVPQGLAKTLGVGLVFGANEQHAWTSDGLFERGPSAWARIFP